MRLVIFKSFQLLQRNLHLPLTTLTTHTLPYSVHTLPTTRPIPRVARTHSEEQDPERDKVRDRQRQFGSSYEFRDTERELFEMERELEQAQESVQDAALERWV